MLLYSLFWEIPRRFEFHVPTFRNTLFDPHKQACLYRLWRWKREFRNVGT